MSERGRSPTRARRARSASPNLDRFYAYESDDDEPSTSTMPIAEPSHRARSASPSTSSFTLKVPGHDTSKLGREHMHRARPYFNTLHVVKFMEGFFCLEDPRDVAGLDLSHLPIPPHGDNLKVGELRRRFARDLCATINASRVCPNLQFRPTGLLGSELHIQAYNVENGTPATDVAIPIYIREDKYFEPVWVPEHHNEAEYDGIRHNLLLEYLYQFQLAPRTHVFAIEITGEEARFVRSDHAGVVATEAFNWKEDSFYLSDFLWRIGQLSNDGLGLDTTWSDVTPEEAEVALAAVKADDPEGNYSQTTVHKLLLFDDPETQGEDVTTYDVLAVLTPRTAPRPELVGRYTMGYRAYCPVTKEVIWVKDSWTRNDPLVEPEGVTMRKLHAAGIPHLARVHSAGYVCRADDTHQVTLSGRPKFKHESVPEAAYTHYRIAFRDIGRPLSTFRSSHELAVVMRDAIEAHTLAFNMGILHRDISQGNVLIGKDGRGMLIDWEMAIDKEKMGSERYDRARSRHCGTYAYLSTVRMRARIAGQRWLHDVGDDRESFFWVLFAMIFRMRYVLSLPWSEGGWSSEDHLTMLKAVLQGNWGEGKLALFRGGADPVTADNFLQYGMEDVVSGRAAPSTLVQLLGSLWQGFARQHGIFNIPSLSWRLAHEFSGDDILSLFNDALGNGGWYEDDAALRTDIVKVLELRLPADLREQISALSSPDVQAAGAMPIPAGSMSSEVDAATGSSQRMKRGRDEEENDDEGLQTVDANVGSKRQRTD